MLLYGNLWKIWIARIKQSMSRTTTEVHFEDLTAPGEEERKGAWGKDKY